MTSRTLIDSVRFEDGKTCMAFTVAFVPNTGNKYVLAACDEHIRLYDFEKAEVRLSADLSAPADPWSM